MFERKYRLIKGVNFSRAKVIETPAFKVKILKNNLPHNRFGFVVSKKVDKRAVVRNSLKRRFRGCLENVSRSLQTGYDFLFLIKKEALIKKTAELCDFTKDMLIAEKLLK